MQRPRDTRATTPASWHLSEHWACKDTPHVDVNGNDNMHNLPHTQHKRSQWTGDKRMCLGSTDPRSWNHLRQMVADPSSLDGVYPVVVQMYVEKNSYTISTSLSNNYPILVRNNSGSAQQSPPCSMCQTGCPPFRGLQLMPAKVYRSQNQLGCCLHSYRTSPSCTSCPFATI